jgi:hypothetical protein
VEAIENVLIYAIWLVFMAIYLFQGAVTGNLSLRAAVTEETGVGDTPVARYHLLSELRGTTE